jgi:endoglucanase
MRNLLLICTLFLFSCRKDIGISKNQTAHVEADNITVSGFVTADDFRYSKMRGFNLSVVQTYDELKAKNIPAARATGANSGRIWVRVVHDASNRYYFQKSTAPKTIDSAVKIAKQVGMYLILTVEFLPRQDAADWWGNATRKNNMVKFWRDSLAKRYKNETTIAAYDLMNEPRRNPKLPGSDAECMTLQSNMVDAIRSVDSNHVIAIEVLDNQMLGRVKPLPQKNLIYSPHGYSPLSITHQGIGSNTARKIYPATSGTYTANYFPNVSYWKAPRDFQLKYNAVIWVGEFSCANYAPKNSLGEWTSTRWIEDVIVQMKQWGWSWSYHAWREWQGWDAEFPSSWYEVNATFTNAKPSKLPPSSARSSTTPTMMVLKKYLN